MCESDQIKNKKLYDNIWESSELSREYRVGKRTRIRIIVDMIQKHHLLEVDKNIIDIGCGDGTFLKMFNPQRAYGLDDSEEGIKLAISRGMPKNNLFVSNIETGKNLPEQKFDLAVCAAVLEHIHQDEKALMNINNILKNKGYLIINVPYSMKYWSAHDVAGGHVKRYEKREIEDKLEKAGFGIIESYLWGFPIYSTYFWLYSKTDPKKAIHAKSPKLLHQLLYNLFKIDDFFKFRGRELYILAQKIR